MLRHHACSLMCMQMFFITFDVGHVVAAIRVGALVPYMVAVIAACVAIM